jgi:hypothetical protein
MLLASCNAAQALSRKASLIMMASSAFDKL